MPACVLLNSATAAGAEQHVLLLVPPQVGVVLLVSIIVGVVLCKRHRSNNAKVAPFPQVPLHRNHVLP